MCPTLLRTSALFHHGPQKVRSMSHRDHHQGNGRIGDYAKFNVSLSPESNQIKINQVNQSCSYSPTGFPEFTKMRISPEEEEEEDDEVSHLASYPSNGKR